MQLVQNYSRYNAYRTSERVCERTSVLVRANDYYIKIDGDLGEGNCVSGSLVGFSKCKNKFDWDSFKVI